MNRSRAPKPAVVKSRPPESGRILADLALVEVSGLRAAVELRGFGEHNLADMLADAIERVYTIHAAAEVRLRGTSPAETAGESHE